VELVTRMPSRFRFGPLERRGLIAGWRGGQIATVGIGLVAAVIVLRSDSSVSGVVIALVAVGMAIAAATWPLSGRTVEEWAPDAVRHAMGSVRRAALGRGDPFRSVSIARVELTTNVSTAAHTRTPLGDGGTPPTRAGVTIDRTTRVYTATFRARAGGFLLLSGEDKERRVAAWGTVLSSMAREGSTVHRLQWTSHSTPAGVTPEALFDAPSAVDVPRERGVAAPTGAAASTGVPGARRSYIALVESEAADAWAHDVLLSVAVRADRAGRAWRGAGGGDRGGCALALQEAAALRVRLRDVGIETGPILSPDELEDVIRRAYGAPRPDRTTERPVETDPTARSGAEPPDPAKRWSTPQWPWPMGVRPEWGRVLLDGTWHTTYWISEWPRTDVGPDFLAPLLLLGGVRYSLSTVMEPMAPLRAARRMEQARTADVADAELRRRGGFLATARRTREQEILVQREMELADGHAPFRFSGYVTVSAENPEALAQAGERILQAAARCGLELRPCYGDQAVAFTTSLPLCRGLA
jgi:hypothetical protein